MDKFKEEWMDNFALAERKKWRYNIKRYINSLKEYKYIDCNTSDYEFWFIYDALLELEEYRKKEKGEDNNAI